MSMQTANATARQRRARSSPRDEMPHVLATLLGEHKYNARLLQVLENQVGLIHLRQKPHAQVMSEVMHYMTHFPDKYHHPKEDLVLARLVLRDPSARSAVRHKKEAHQRIGADGRVLFALLERYRAGDPGASEEDVRVQAVAYIKELRRHMDAEELRLYPWARRVLHKADWHEVDEQLQSVLDPVFGAEVAEHYQALHKHYTESIKEVEIGRLRMRFEEAVAVIEGLSALIGGLKRISARISEHNRAALRMNREHQRKFRGLRELSEIRAAFDETRSANRGLRESLVADVRALWDHTHAAARRPFQHVAGNGPALFRWLGQGTHD